MDESYSDIVSTRNIMPPEPMAFSGGRTVAWTLPIDSIILV
jgi:hypothetical protein